MQISRPDSGLVSISHVDHFPGRRFACFILESTPGRLVLVALLGAGFTNVPTTGLGAALGCPEAMARSVLEVHVVDFLAEIHQFLSFP